jgi:hypothetical protein
MRCWEETKRIHAGEVGRTSSNQRPKFKPEHRFTAGKPQQSDLDKLA